MLSVRLGPAARVGASAGSLSEICAGASPWMYFSRARSTKVRAYVLAVACARNGLLSVALTFRSWVPSTELNDMWSRSRSRDVE